MISLIRSEIIKGRRNFGRKGPYIFPLLVTLMGNVLMGGQLVQIGAYNWWYRMLLPTVLVLVCINLTIPEKRMRFFNVSVLPVPKDIL